MDQTAACTALPCKLHTHTQTNMHACTFVHMHACVHTQKVHSDIFFPAKLKWGKRDKLDAADKGKAAAEIKEGGFDKREVQVESTGANQCEE